MTSRAPQKVVFVHRVTCDYSKDFLVQLHDRLRERGIAFVVASGSPWAGEGLVDVLADLPFGIRCENRRLAGPLYWAQGVMKAVRGADLVIAEQLTGSLHLYPLLVRRWVGLFLRRLAGLHRRSLLAFYGHGATLSRTRWKAILGGWKRFVSRQVDWWLAYTSISADIVANAGFPRQKITVFQNTIDATGIQSRRAELDDDHLSRLRKSLFGDGGSRPTGVFCGRLVDLKWIPFLLTSIGRIHAAVPEFRMVIVGDGPDGPAVSAFCQANPWCAWVGRQQDLARVPYLAMGDVWLNPGMTGLAIVDAFAVGVPWVTTDNGIHSPEIAYLRNGKNGMMVAPDADVFADEVIRLLGDSSRLDAMKREARLDGGRYTVENMVKNIEQGVLQCLEQA